ncbi:DUF5677 domain-containing protein [Paenibacillus sp. GP183]|uniref:DUF5677 domain-containing protein n=1 Tax=Paenibacillus sp. GP183 TaxID=1882751 RepID=UPI00089CE6F6|nr:DUF5677 domain-containing protein [Paenibacillus sp. GP183]SEB45753.1 hypothetical protein SAMN05443246_0457 [Paenibacillus sp. GP183]
MEDFTYKFPSGFKIAENLLETSQKALDIPIGSTLRGILLSLQLKCHRLFAASITLIRTGYAVEAQSHLRSILETMISAKYLILDPVKHGDMFKNFEIIEKWKMAEDYEQAMKLYICSPSIIVADPLSEEFINAYKSYQEACESLNKLKPQYEKADSKRNEWIEELKQEGIKRPNKDSWSLRNNYEMALATGMDFYYFMVFKTFSNLVHPSTLSANKYRSKTDGLLIDPSPLGIRRDLMGACVLNIHMTHTIAEFYSNNIVLEQLEFIGKEIEVIRASNEFKEVDPIFGRS